MFIAAGCGYSPDKNDVVNEYGKNANIEVFQQFVTDAKKGKKTEVRIVNYTDEGDPVLHDIHYNGEEFTSKLDFSRDKYSKGGTSTATCSSLDTEVKEEAKIYKLTGCDQIDTEPTLLVIRE